MKFLLTSAMSLLDTAKLFLNIHSLHLLKTYRIFGRIGLAIVGCRCLLPPRCFLLRYWHSGNTIIYIIALAGEALEVIRSLIRSDDGRVSGFSLRSLLLPAGVKKLD